MYVSKSLVVWICSGYE